MKKYVELCKFIDIVNVIKFHISFYKSNIFIAWKHLV